MTPTPNGRQPGECRILRGSPRFLDHGPHRQLTGPAARSGLVAVDEQEPVHPIRCRRQQIPAEPKQVTVPGVQARDATGAHRLHLMRDRHARHRRPPDMVVGNQERVRDRAQHPDLVAHPRQVRASRRLDLADQLETTISHAVTIQAALPAKAFRQVYRLVVERPERLSLKILMALLDILDCTMDDLIEPVAAAVAAQRSRKAAAGGTADAAGIGALRPR